MPIGNASFEYVNDSFHLNTNENGTTMLYFDQATNLVIGDTTFQKDQGGCLPTPMLGLVQNQGWTMYRFVLNIQNIQGAYIISRLSSQTTNSRWQVDKEAMGLSGVQQCYHLYIARPYHISVYF